MKITTRTLLKRICILAIIQISFAFRRCPVASDELSYGSGEELTEQTVQSNNYMKVSEITVWVGHPTEPGLNDQFNSIEFTMQSINGSAVETLTVQGSTGPSGLMHVVQIPIERTVVAVETGRDSLGSSAYLKGLKIYLDDGDYFEIGGEFGISDGVFMLPGPLVGLQWHAEEVIQSLQFLYDECYCDSSTFIQVDSYPNNLISIIGETVTVSFSA